MLRDNIPGRHEQMSTHPREGLTTDHSEDSSDVHIGELMSFTGLPYRSERLLIRAETTQRQLGHQRPPQPRRLQSWELGIPCTACRQLSGLQSVLSRGRSGSTPLPGSWACQRATQPSSPLALGRRSLVNLVSFRAFRKLSWVFTFWFKELSPFP